MKSLKLNNFNYLAYILTFLFAFVNSWSKSFRFPRVRWRETEDRQSAFLPTVRQLVEVLQQTKISQQWKLPLRCRPNSHWQTKEEQSNSQGAVGFGQLLPGGQVSRLQHPKSEGVCEEENHGQKERSPELRSHHHSDCDSFRADDFRF